jgi:hypothetical protein
MGTLHELPDPGDPSLDDGGSDVAFGFMLFVLWGFSIARVVAAAEAREVFGAEASLAFICMIALPVWALQSLVNRPRRRPRPYPERQSAVVVAFRRRALADAASERGPFRP